MDVEKNLSSLGVVLPEAPAPVAAYVPAVRSGNLLIVSGQLPLKDGKLLKEGNVIFDVSIEEAQECAKQCVLNGLAILRKEIEGDWSRFSRVVKLGAFVQSDPGFKDQAKVANGASEFLEYIFGDAGKHARAAVGVNALPLDAPVEIEFMFELKETS